MSRRRSRARARHPAAMRPQASSAYAAPRRRIVSAAPRRPRDRGGAVGGAAVVRAVGESAPRPRAEPAVNAPRCRIRARRRAAPGGLGDLRARRRRGIPRPSADAGSAVGDRRNPPLSASIRGLSRGPSIRADPGPVLISRSDFLGDRGRAARSRTQSRSPHRSIPRVSGPPGASAPLRGKAARPRRVSTLRRPMGCRGASTRIPSICPSCRR